MVSVQAQVMAIMEGDVVQAHDTVYICKNLTEHSCRSNEKGKMFQPQRSSSVTKLSVS